MIWCGCLTDHFMVKCFTLDVAYSCLHNNIKYILEINLSNIYQHPFNMTLREMMQKYVHTYNISI